MIDAKTERHEIEVLKQDIATKVHKHDHDLLVVQVENMRAESEQKIGNAEKDIDDFIETV